MGNQRRFVKITAYGVIDVEDVRNGEMDIHDLLQDRINGMTLTMDDNEEINFNVIGSEVEVDDDVG